MENEDIKNTWQKETLQLCINPKQNTKTSKLYCERKKINYNFILDVEYFSETPLIFKISKFLEKNNLKKIEQYFEESTLIEKQTVEGYVYSKGHQGRSASGLWLEHDVKIVNKYFKKLQKILRINPAIAEEFLILKYDKFDHYAIHYDYLNPMEPEYDNGWFVFYGNRIATALLIVKTAEIGGYTIFPRLNLTIIPEPGDLIFWFNADSNNKKEINSLHAACPIQNGTKIAISLWIRKNFQDHLKCALTHPGYDSYNIFRKINSKNDYKISKKFLKRPSIPTKIFKPKY